MTAPELAFYGDDLTGSTDVMEALTLRGTPTVLFTAPPTARFASRFADARAIGLAGTSRSETPDWMEAHLPSAFAFLAATGAPVCHYKVCSTFDSAPGIGSIGRALEIGRRVFGEAVVPIVVGAPELRRWTVFGQLFAAYRGQVYRIDRHPVTGRHPVTPMDEADLVRHLARQTALHVAHVNQLDLARACSDKRVDSHAAGAAALLLDVADEASQRQAGRQLRRLAAGGCRFVIGSSGVEYALARGDGEGTARSSPALPPLAPVRQIVVVSGSVSPTTERQIRHAAAHGFVPLAVDPLPLAAGGDAAGAAIGRARDDALAALAAGGSPILFTAMGGAGDGGVRRAAIAGGDTSSHALGCLGNGALTLRTPFPATPGSPLCTAHAEAPDMDGLEIALKGGQVGGDDYFVAIRDGTA